MKIQSLDYFIFVFILIENAFTNSWKKFLLVLVSSRRLEVSRVELLLQVGAFCVAIGALVSGNPSAKLLMFICR